MTALVVKVVCLSSCFGHKPGIHYQEKKGRLIAIAAGQAAVQQLCDQGPGASQVLDILLAGRAKEEIESITLDLTRARCADDGLLIVMMSYMAVAGKLRAPLVIRRERKSGDVDVTRYDVTQEEPLQYNVQLA